MKKIEGHIFLFKNGKFLIFFSYLFNYISSKKVFKTLKNMVLTCLFNIYFQYVKNYYQFSTKYVLFNYKL